MPFDVGALMKRTLKTVVHYQGEEFEVEYHKKDIAWTLDMAEAERSQDIEKLITKASEMIVSWDLTYNGEEFELSQENLRYIPPDMLGAIMTHCNTASTEDENRAEKNGSSGSSSRRR